MVDLFVFCVVGVFSVCVVGVSLESLVFFATCSVVEELLQATNKTENKILVIVLMTGCGCIGIAAKNARICGFC